MQQKSLAIWLRVIMVFVSIVAAVFLLWVLPVTVREMGEGFPEFAMLTLPCLISVWACAIPVAVAIVSFFRITGEVGRDNSFCEKNAKLLKLIGIMAVVDTGITTFVLALTSIYNAINGGALILMFTVIVFGLTVAIMAFVLSHLVLKASKLREDNELTI